MKEIKVSKPKQKIPLKLSCVPVSFFKNIISGQMSFKQLAALCAKLGLSAVDLGVTLLGDQSNAYLKDVRTQIEDAGIKIAGIMAYPDFTNPNIDQRKAEIEFFKRHLESAAILGAQFIRVTAGQTKNLLKTLLFVLCFGL